VRGGDDGEGEKLSQSPPPNLPTGQAGSPPKVEEFQETPMQSIEEFF